MADLVKDGWFHEVSNEFPGQSFGLKVEEILCREKSKFQDILVFKSETYGRVMVLDGIIQSTERDEFVYQEMIANLPLFSHPSPKEILVIGGGDGGVVREIDKHPAVERIVLCEIDDGVIEISKKHLPHMAVGLQSSKLEIQVADGFEYLSNNTSRFDVIITDSSDPVGPAEALFQRNYYELLKQSLKPDGILCSQGENFFLDLPIIKSMRSFCKELFPVVEYATCFMPTYTGGQIGFILCSKDKNTNFLDPYPLDAKLASKFRYYDTDIHKSAFCLPACIQRELI